MNKKQVILALRSVLEAANSSDSDGETANDLPACCASSRHLFGTVAAALGELGQSETIDRWAETGEWPPVD